jgi:hypothetical protein
MSNIDKHVYCVVIIIFAATMSHAARSTTVSSMENAFLFDTTVMYTQARGNQRWSSAAYDGTNYLVVWHDSRFYPQHDVFCARIDPEGHLLDSAGIHVATVTFDNLHYYCNATPAVAYNGTYYLVVFQDRRNSVETDIYGARVTPSGNVLDPDGIAISTAQGYQWHPCVASNGSDFLIVWQDLRMGTPDIYGARVDHNGIVLEPDGIAVSSAPRSQEFPSVASDGTDYFAVWHDARDSTNTQYDIYGARITADGILLDTNSVAIFVGTAQQTEPSIVSDGTDYFIVWEDWRAQVLAIMGARVDSLANVLDPNGIGISGMPSMMEWYPSLAFNGTDYLVVWADDRNGIDPDIYGARVDRNGTLLDSLNIPISVTDGMKWMPCVTTDGDDFLVAWDDDRDFPSGDIYGSRVSATGSVLDPVGLNITTSAVFHVEPGVAYCGENFLAAWADVRSGLYLSDIYGARVDATGVLLDSPGFAICTAQFGQYSPYIAFNGTNYCSIWTHNIGGAWSVKGARISPAGTVLDPAYISVSSAGNAMSPQIATHGSGFFTVWVDYRNSYTSPDIYGARIASAGYVLDPAGFAISNLGGLEYGPTVCFGDVHYLVAWERGSSKDIYCARIDTNGVILDPIGIAVTTAAELQENTVIAFDGTNYLLVWQDNRNGDYDIYCARVAQSGAVLDPAGIAVSTAPNDQINPSVVFDGVDYIVVWEDYRQLPSDIYGAIIDTSGAVIDSFLAIAQPGPQSNPKLSHGPGTKTLLAYCGWTEYINTHPANALRIWGKFHPELGVTEHIEETKATSSLSFSPNPFTNQAQIRYSILDTRYSIQNSALAIYDVSGRLVKSFNLESSIQSQESAISWYGDDDAGRKLPSGVYFIQLSTGAESVVEKVLLVR